MLTKADIEKYFLAEKQTGLIFLVIGIIAILLAITFFFYWKSSLHKGMAVPLIVFGLLEAVAGYTVYDRSDKQRVDNVYAFDMNPGQLQNNEFPRMQKVVKNFVVYRTIQIALLMLGVGLIFLYRDHPARAFLYGIGITLTIQSVLMFTADYFAAKRAGLYTSQIENFLESKFSN